jgi:hypothetical protein
MAENMPKQPPPPPAYLSEVPSRSYSAGGTYKHHRNIGHAKAAIKAAGRAWDVESRRYAGLRGGKIYKWDFEKSEWELIFDVPYGSTSYPWE